MPIYSTSGVVQSGEWITIFGDHLADATTVWNGDFPASLGGTSVTINGKAAYLWYVSRGQINLQVPDDPTTGPVPVVVNTANGTVTSTVTLAPRAPAFSMLDATHVAGIILRTDNSGTHGGGTTMFSDQPGLPLVTKQLPQRRVTLLNCSAWVLGRLLRRLLQ